MGHVTEAKLPSLQHSLGVIRRLACVTRIGRVASGVSAVGSVSLHG